MEVVALDAGPLGLLVHPNPKGPPRDCRIWFKRLERAGSLVILPEIADYEVRRELIRIGSRSSIARLDALKYRCFYLPVSTPGMLLAAELWAALRRQGKPSTDAARLDADVILAAHAQVYAEAYSVDVVVATTNVRHLGQIAEARRWQDIQPVGL